MIFKGAVQKSQAYQPNYYMCVYTSEDTGI